MIASIVFHRFKALRNTRLELAPFNLVVGPNGSGKTSLIQAVLQLRNLAKLPLVESAPPDGAPEGPEITFTFDNAEGSALSMHCREHARCDALRLTAGDARHWPALQETLLGARAYLLDHYAMAQPGRQSDDEPLASNGANLVSVVERWSRLRPTVFSAYRDEVIRLFAEYDELRVETAADGLLSLSLRLTGIGEWVDMDSLSQGTLYALALCAIAHDPAPPAIVCLEELDRGLHPRLLREVRDVVYRLSYPRDYGLERDPVQVIATTHSPYLLDLFRDHPEEVVIAEKQGRAATFSRLSDRQDLGQLLEEGSLGDVWFAGLLGGVPEDK